MAFRFEDILKELESDKMMEGFFKVDKSKPGEWRIFLLGKGRKVKGIIEEVGMSTFNSQVMTEGEAYKAFKEWFDREVMPF